MYDEIIKKEDYRGFTFIIRKIGYHVPVEYKSSYLGDDYWFCGYVNIPQNHPYYHKDYHEIYDEIDVHGGLTFSGSFNSFDGYWIGFDCNHYHDNHFVQNEDYTTSECKKLIDQLIDIFIVYKML